MGKPEMTKRDDSTNCKSNDTGVNKFYIIDKFGQGLASVVKVAGKFHCPNIYEADDELIRELMTAVCNVISASVPDDILHCSLTIDECTGEIDDLMETACA